MPSTTPTRRAAAPGALLSGPASRPGPARPGGPRRRRALRRSLTGVAFTLPALALFAIFIAWPVFQTVRLSFFDWDGLSPDKLWIGFENYTELFSTDPDFGRALRNTGLWTVVTVPAQMAVGLALALLLDRNLRGRTAYRTIFFLPAVMSSVVIVFGWSWMYNPDIGVINGVLSAVGLPEQKWLGDPHAALWASMAVSVWRYAGICMLFYLAGLQMIDPALYEAARVDGASGWRQVRRITLPLLRPMTALLVLVGLINSLREFEIIWILTRGGPAHATDLLSTQVFHQAFEQSRYGYAAAIATILLAITVAAGAVALLFLRRAQRSVA